jgi:hypothetical protein
MPTYFMVSLPAETLLAVLVWRMRFWLKNISPPRAATQCLTPAGDGDTSISTKAILHWWFRCAQASANRSTTRAPQFG